MSKKQHKIKTDLNEEKSAALPFLSSEHNNWSNGQFFFYRNEIAPVMPLYAKEHPHDIVTRPAQDLFCKSLLLLSSAADIFSLCKNTINKNCEAVKIPPVVC